MKNGGMNEKRLAEIEGRVAAATDEPWECDQAITHATGGYRQAFLIMAGPLPELNGRRAILATRGFANISKERANGILAANAPTDLADLAAAYRSVVGLLEGHRDIKNENEAEEWFDVRDDFLATYHGGKAGE